MHIPEIVLANWNSYSYLKKTMKTKRKNSKQKEKENYNRFCNETKLTLSLLKMSLNLVNNILTSKQYQFRSIDSALVPL